MADSPESLAALQQQFISALFNPPGTVTCPEIAGEGGLDAEQRLGIYRNSAQAIHREHLKVVYPVCGQLLGEAFFSQLATYYSRHFPPASAFLSDYGGQLAEVIVEHEKLQPWRWVADIAQLEWARHYAWHRPNQPASDWGRLAGMDAQQQAGLRFALPASATLIRSRYAIHQVWSAHQQGSEQAFADIVLEQGECVLVWREGRQVFQQPLDEKVCSFLHYAEQGKTLAEIVALQGADVSGVLARCVAQSWLVLKDD
ncbi:MAG: DNA-binding domain-containing protein [Thiolinea sp.]